jgi:AcrR family transcriptional regulator
VTSKHPPKKAPPKKAPSKKAAAKQPRRTQEERTATMRARLLDATIDCLVERGYAGTTTTAVVERAGVSRGAQLHHFPTKRDLVTAAVEYIMDRRNDEFRAAFADVSLGPDLVDQVVDGLWQIFRGDTFYAWLELLVAARTDPELGAQVTDIAERFQASVDETFRELFGLAPDAAKRVAFAPRFTFLVLEGLALEHIRGKREGEEERVLKVLKQLAPQAIQMAMDKGF